MPDWARGRMNATMTMVAQGATALGGAIWGLAAHGFGVGPTFLGAAGFALLLMVLVHLVPALRISIDFTASVTFEPAPLVLLSQNLAPGRLPAPREGPVSITAEFQVDPARRDECVDLMREARLIFLRNGAYCGGTPIFFTFPFLFDTASGGSSREKALNALRQLIDELEAGPFPDCCL